MDIAGIVYFLPIDKVWLWFFIGLPEHLLFAKGEILGQ